MTLKSFRNTAGLSIKSVSEKTGIPQSTLWNYEKQNALPNRKAAIKLATAYGLSLRDLEALVKNSKGETRAQFEEKAQDFKAKYEPAEKAPEETEAKPEPPVEPPSNAAEEPKPAEPVLEATVEPEPDEVTLEAAETPEPTLPWTKTVTNEDYLNAANMAVRALKEVIGTDSKTVMLAVMFVTAEIQNRLFI